jgi:hypothetical protein
VKAPHRIILECCEILHMTSERWLFWKKQWTSWFNIRQGISWVVEQLLASQEELCSMELVVRFDLNQSICSCNNCTFTWIIFTHSQGEQLEIKYQSTNFCDLFLSTNYEPCNIISHDYESPAGKYATCSYLLEG